LSSSVHTDTAFPFFGTSIDGTSRDVTIDRRIIHTLLPLFCCCCCYCRCCCCLPCSTYFVTGASGRQDRCAAFSERISATAAASDALNRPRESKVTPGSRTARKRHLPSTDVRVCLCCSVNVCTQQSTDCQWSLHPLLLSLHNVHQRPATRNSLKSSKMNVGRHADRYQQPSTAFSLLIECLSQAAHFCMRVSAD
jgi:hypothetical protein